MVELSGIVQVVQVVAAADVPAADPDLRHGVAAALLLHFGAPRGFQVDAHAFDVAYTLALEKPAGDTNGTLVRVTIQHRYEAPFEIGRFRIWVTTGVAPAAEGLPGEIAALVKVAPKSRNDQQRTRLQAHYRALDPEMLKLDFGADLARKPLPEDERLKELELELARATKPVLTDPVVVQLRKDVELSAQQLAHKRLTATQDLTWALINTPSFLFNR